MGPPALPDFFEPAECAELLSGAVLVQKDYHQSVS